MFHTNIYTFTDTHALIYIYTKHMYMYLCIYKYILLKRYVYIYIYIYIYVYLGSILFVNANFIEHNRHFMPTYSLLDPFEFPYYFYRIRGELIKVLSIVVCYP